MPTRIGASLGSGGGNEEHLHVRVGLALNPPSGAFH